jgi:elongation factor G
MADPFGRLTFLRVYSGVLAKGSYAYNSTKGTKERIARLIVLKSNERIEVDELRAGDLQSGDRTEKHHYWGHPL